MINVKENVVFFSGRAEKGIAWQIDASSVVGTLIYHGNLANRIARLAAIVVKKKIHGLDRFHGNGPYGKIPTKKEPIRTLGFTLPYNK